MNCSIDFLVNDLLYIIELSIKYDTYLVYCFCTALAGSCLSVCAGSRPCGPAVLRPLDGQRWPTETDGKAHCVLTAFRGAVKMKKKHRSCLLIKHSPILLSPHSLCVTIMTMVRLQPSSCVMCVETCALTVTVSFICIAAPAPTRDRYTAVYMTGTNNKKQNQCNRVGGQTN